MVDGIVEKFEAANPDIKVNAIYSGNYDDTRVRALSAIASGEPAQLAVMFSIDAYDLIEQDLIVPFDDYAKTDEEKEAAIAKATMELTMKPLAMIGTVSLLCLLLLLYSVFHNHLFFHTAVSLKQ